MIINSIIESSAAPLLPSIYQEVEYIQGDGTVCLNTGQKVNGINFIDITMTVDGRTVDWASAFGVDYPSGKKIQLGYRTSDTSMSYNYGSSNTTKSIVNNVFYRFLIYNGFLEYKRLDTNAWAAAGGMTSFTGATNDFYVLAAGTNQSEGYYGISKGKVKRVIIGTSIDSVDYTYYGIPCYLKSDNTKIGIYDAIGKTFNTGSGAGVFTKGNDV